MRGNCILELVVLVTVSSTCNAKVKIATNPGTYADYPLNCSRKDYSAFEHEEISSILNQHNVTSAWLPLKRIPFSMWKWMNGENYVKTISDPDWVIEGYDCGLLRAGDQIIDDVPCRQTLRHILCETKEKNCSSITDGSSCIENKGKSYVVYSNTNFIYTWFMAKQHCHDNSMSLASFGDQDRRKIMEKLSLTLGPYDKVWLGLRKSEYRLELSKQENKDIFQFNWGLENPCVCPEKECVIVRQDGKWAAENCTAIHEFLCYVKEPGSKEINLESDEQDSSSVASVVMAIVFPLFAVIVLSIVIFCLLRGKISTERLEHLCFCCHSLKWKRRDEQNADEIAEAAPLTKTANKVREKVMKPNKPKKENPNIILIGLAGAGKSSLINSLVACVHNDGHHDWCLTGSYGEHGTKGTGAITQQLCRNKLFEDYVVEKETEKDTPDKQHEKLLDECRPTLLDCPGFMDDTRKNPKEKKEEETPDKQQEELLYKCRPTLWDCPGFIDDSGKRTKEVLHHLFTGAVSENTAINHLLEMDDSTFSQQKFIPDEDRKIDLILMVHAANFKTYPENLMEAVRETASKDKHGKHIPIFLVVTKKDLVPDKKERKKILQEAAAKVGLQGNAARVFLVSSYSEKTVPEGQKRNTKLDIELCKLWEKLLDPSLYKHRGKSAKVPMQQKRIKQENENILHESD